MYRIKDNYKIIITIILIMFAEWVVLKQYYNYIPNEPPNLNIAYKGKDIKLCNADYNWFDKNSGGNSNIYGDPFKALENYDAVEVSNEGSLEYSFSKKPVVVSVILFRPDGSEWKTYDRYYKFYSDKKEDRTLSLPKEKGMYIMMVDGEWDETHNTSNVFKISVN